MTEVERALLQSLVDLETAVAGMKKPGPKPDLIPLFSRIADLARQLPRATDPTLMHYLQKKSYQKARLFLEGRDADNQVGNCRHV